MRKFRIKRDGWWVLADILDSGDAFRTAGSMRGETDVYPAQGHMPQSEWELMKSRARDGMLDYAVYSYSTIIGYRVGSEWFVPDCSYSRTTTIQQNKLRTAVANLPVSS